MSDRLKHRPIRGNKETEIDLTEGEVKELLKKKLIIPTGRVGPVRMYFSSANLNQINKVRKAAETLASA